MLSVGQVSADWPSVAAAGAIYRPAGGGSQVPPLAASLALDRPRSPPPPPILLLRPPLFCTSLCLFLLPNTFCKKTVEGILELENSCLRESRCCGGCRRAAARADGQMEGRATGHCGSLVARCTGGIRGIWGQRFLADGWMVWGAYATDRGKYRVAGARCTV